MTIEIDLNELPHPHPDVFSWIEANKIVAKAVPVDQTIEIEINDRGPSLTLDLFVMDPHGRHMWDTDEDGEAFPLKERVTVPLLMHPANYTVFDRVLS